MEELHNQSSALQALLDLSGEGACLVHLDGWRIAYANESLLHWVGRPPNAWQGVSLFDWIANLRTPDMQDQLLRLAAGEMKETKFLAQLSIESDGESAVEVCIRRVGSSEGLVAVAVRRLPAAAPRNDLPVDRRVDPLTGLADRAFFIDRLNTLLQGDRAADHHCAVLFVDVDGFKQVNDTYGHLVGDRVLREVAGRLAACVRAGDHVARFGGDEFVVLLERVRCRNGVQPVVERIRAAFDRPVAVPRGEVALTVSVGVAEAGAECGTAEDLIDAADRAMYAAKHAIV